MPGDRVPPGSASDAGRAMLIEGAGRLALGVAVAARAALAGGDSEALAFAGVMDVVDGPIEGLGPESRAAVERVARDIVAEVYRGA